MRSTDGVEGGCVEDDDTVTRMLCNPDKYMVSNYSPVC